MATGQKQPRAEIGLLEITIEPTRRSERPEAHYQSCDGDGDGDGSTGGSSTLGVAWSRHEVEKRMSGKRKSSYVRSIFGPSVAVPRGKSISFLIFVTVRKEGSPSNSDGFGTGP